jgi:hypothetical protein
MPTLFGQSIEPDFDLNTERRNDRVGWVLIGGTLLCGIYLLWGKPFATEVFQGWFATILPYGTSFYVKQRNNLGKSWLWKAVLTSLPVHALYLLGIFWSDKAFPEFMTKAVVFIPVLAVGFGVESALLFDRIVGWFKPRGVDRSFAPPAEK